MTEDSDSQLPPDVLARLRCPVTRSPLHLEGGMLVSEVGGLRYPIRDGIPVLLAEEAQLPTPFKSLDEFRARHGC